MVELGGGVVVLETENVVSLHFTYRYVYVFIVSLICLFRPPDVIEVFANFYTMPCHA